MECKEDLKGEFSILFIDCIWQLSFAAERITDESDVVDIERATKYLDGTYLISFAEVQTLEAIVILTFDNEASLSVKANGEVDEMDNWSITVKGRETWAVCPDGTIKK